VSIAAGPALDLRLDPIDFEILRHRLWAINDEACATIRLVSGSPVATEANDMNTALMDASGDVCVVGCYSLAKATTMSSVVKDILREYAENPGIREGDAFICNDPYVGAQHQNDTALVMPVFQDGELIAWTGAELHLVDVGGPVAGQVQIGARDIFGEAPLIPPIKILEGDRVRRDIEREYLRRSRLPEAMGLDLRAKLAATTVARRRIQELAAEYGRSTVVDAMADMMDYVEARFRARLSELPDGTWRHRAYMEWDGEIYVIAVAMRKQGDELGFDFRGTSRQAPAGINATLDALAAIARGNVCTLLCWDIPWCPSAVGRAVQIATEPGTLVDAEWPAGVSKSTTTTLWVLGKSMTVLVGKMLLCSEVHADRAMASWQGGLLLEEIFGRDDAGRPFGGTQLDAMAGGGGAGTTRDGVDTGGYIGSVRISIANVETTELQYPLLYLWRREQADSGGAGTHRGGNGVTYAYVPHRTPGIETKIVHGIGVEQPLSSGISGGRPSTTNIARLHRDADVAEAFAAGRIPDDAASLGGRPEPLGYLAQTSQGAQDAYVCVSCGGGGLGDPLLRDPEDVRQDVVRRAVTPGWAEAAYGVVLRELEGAWAVDAPATTERRAAARRARRDAAGAGDALS
jgi:N-methylhydantoinase B